MTTFKARFVPGNGYADGWVSVPGANNAQQAKRILSAQYPGAKFCSVVEDQSDYQQQQRAERAAFRERSKQQVSDALTTSASNLKSSAASFSTCFDKPSSGGSYAPPVSGNGGLLLVGGAMALYFAALYAPFVCAGGSAIVAGKYIKTRWHWKTFWVLLFALVGFLGGDVVKQKAGLGEYQDNPAKMNIVEEVVDTIFTQPIRNSAPRS